MKKYALFTLLSLCLQWFPYTGRAAMRTEMRNLVVFVAFKDADNEPFTHDSQHYNRLFNDPTVGANSVYAYFKHSSYNQLTWLSSFAPAAKGDVIAYYRTTNARNFYLAKKDNNPNGYQDEVDKAAREQSLIKEIAAWLDTNLPESQQIDADNDGLIDNITLVFAGMCDVSAKYLLWPHRSDLILPDSKAVYINGKKMVSYIMVFDQANGFNFSGGMPLGTGVLCHEMSHSLGTYDLYHVNDNLNPVGVWDLMSDNQQIPQQMSAYTKWRYCQWLDTIPTISEAGTYTLNPIGGTTKDNVAYKIKPIGSDEYFVVEYRQKTGYDNSIPQSGLLVYRINPKYTGGNLNYNGTTRTDEMYIFRPGGSITEDGNISEAALSSTYGRSVFGTGQSLHPFYSDGQPAHFTIKNISAAGSTISFDLEQLPPLVYIPQSAITLAGKAGSEVRIRIESGQPWTLENTPNWLSIQPTQGDAGYTDVTISAPQTNEEALKRITQLVFKGTQQQQYTDTLNITQQSYVLQSPSHLTATANNQAVTLQWIPAIEGAPVIFNDFEAENSLDNWIITNSDNRGWTRQQSGKYSSSQAYEGTHSVWMNVAWEDARQDQKLISPTFANGTMLTFWSKSTAPGMVQSKYHYHVEVSQDNGQSWQSAYDLMKEGTRKNQYEQVFINLQPYQSETMQVRFHAWDELEGLSYWWTLDNIAVFGTPQEQLVTGYQIYRNGEKIATTTTTNYTDEHPLNGDNTYTVTAIGNFGETEATNAATVNMVVDQIFTTQATPTTHATTVYNLQGVKVGTVDRLHALPKGIYIVGRRKVVR